MAKDTGPRLAPGAALLLECAPPQTGPLAAQLAAAGWRAVRIHADRYGRERIVEGRR